MKVRCLALALLTGFASVEAAAQSALPRKDIPAIAKAANGAIVTIITAVNDKPIAQGSGFLVSADGVIVTNYHVIETGNVAIVKFPDDTAFRVDGVLAADKVRDLAVIKIHGKTFRALALGDSDDIQVGEEVVAIGNPLSLESTVSNGIISGVRTSKQQGGKFLQTTAPISRGSSGGPLFNMFGEVVGINVMFLEGGESLNFAIPVNDAKLLLSHQAAKLQNLPDESEADSPEPDPPHTGASTSGTSDAEPPTNDLGIVDPSQNTAGGKQQDLYYVRSYEHGTYVIENNGRRYAATCRESLHWPYGIDKPGRPSDHCSYMPHLVGLHIRTALMWRQDQELRYEPLAGYTHFADVLDIISEAPIGSPLRRPTPKTSPEILKTLHWIQNTLDDGEGRTLSSESLELNSHLAHVSGCQVTFGYYQIGSDHQVIHHDRFQVNLGDLDPASLTVGDDYEDKHVDIQGPVRDVTVHTTDKVPAVHNTFNDRSWNGSWTVPATDLFWQLPAPYAPRFVKALEHAITLCGGKASTF